jgi:predicted site-specific integrase-resolvase
MKKILLITLVFALAFNQSLFSQKSISKDLGLVSKLVYYKDKAENIFSIVINDTIGSKVEREQLLANYLTLKTKIDQFVFQLNADLKSKGKLKLYKKLNESVVEGQVISSNTRVNSFLEKLGEVEAAFNDVKASWVIIKKIHTDDKSLATDVIGSITGIVGCVYGIYKDVRDANMAKVDKVATILDVMRLSPVKDLLVEKTKK